MDYDYKLVLVVVKRKVFHIFPGTYLVAKFSKESGKTDIVIDPKLDIGGTPRGWELSTSMQSKKLKHLGSRGWYFNGWDMFEDSFIELPITNLHRTLYGL